MFLARTLLLTLTALALAGCSAPKPAETAAAEPAPAPSVATPKDTRPVIVAFGDSLTDGPPGKSYPDYLQSMLDKAGLPYRVINQGVGGNTTTDGLARLDAVLAEKPKIVVLELGGNDGLRGLPVPATQANLDRMLQTFKEAGITVLLAGITLPPNYGPEYIGPFEQMYKDLAAKHRVAFLPFLYKGVVGVPGSMQPDGIHATPQGNVQVAKNVFESLRPLLVTR